MSALFSPFRLKGITLRNRLAVAPMCQYAADAGFTTDWHYGHYPALARGGAGLVVVEATAVSPEGRITPAVVGFSLTSPGSHSTTDFSMGSHQLCSYSCSTGKGDGSRQRRT